MKITTVEEEKAEKKVIKPKVKKEEKQIIPMGYITVKLDSLGKLTAPFELHFRDYSIEEVMELASTDSDIDNLEVMINILNSMVFEDFNCGDLTIYELLEVVFTLQGSFYSPEIEKHILIDEEGDESDKENYIYALIPISNLKTDTIKEEFQEPFTLTDSKLENTTYSFRLPRVKDKVVAEDFLKDKYKKELREFSEIYHEISEIEKIKNDSLRMEKMGELEAEKSEELMKFKDYLFNKGKLMLALTQALSLVSINGEEVVYGDCEKLLEVLPTISKRVWQEYTHVLEKYKFGLNEEVTFFVPELSKEVTRRLSFRILDFLPDNEQENSTGVNISFG